MTTYTNQRRSLRWRLGLVDPYGVTGLGMIVGAVVTITALVAVTLTLVVSVGRTVGRTTCRNFATETGFQTKFRVLNFFDTGKCLAKAPNGKWVLNSRIYQFLQETKR